MQTHRASQIIHQYIVVINGHANVAKQFCSIGPWMYETSLKSGHQQRLWVSIGFDENAWTKTTECLKRSIVEWQQLNILEITVARVGQKVRENQELLFAIQILEQEGILSQKLPHAARIQTFDSARKVLVDRPHQF